MEKKVKCSECGYLALRIYRGGIPSEFAEITENGRTTGYLPSSEILGARLRPFGEEIQSTNVGGKQLPSCFVAATSLGREIRNLLDADKEAKLEKVILQVTMQERACISFTEWKPGRTPKEHQEMLDRQWMLDREDRRDKEQREWQKKREESDKWLRIALVMLSGLFILIGAAVGVWYQTTISPKQQLPVINNYIQVPGATSQSATPSPTPATQSEKGSNAP